MKLLVFEQDSARPLAGILADHLPGWDIVPAATDFAHAEGGFDAALIAEAGMAADIAGTLRQSGMIGPILALTETDSIAPPVIAPPVIALGKPLRLADLIAKLEAPGDAAIDGAVIGDWRFDAGTRALLHKTGARSERLTDKEVQMLGVLLRAPAGISREALQEAAFGYGPGIDTHTVETHIWRLRQKLEADPAAPRLLLTESQDAGVVYFIKRA